MFACLSFQDILQKLLFSKMHSTRHDAIYKTWNNQICFENDNAMVILQIGNSVSKQYAFQKIYI